MKPEKQRVVIAEACGWKFEFQDDGSVTVISPTNQLRSNWFPQDFTGQHTSFRIVNLPDYLNDLNAMHSAWTVLSNDEKILCASWLKKLAKIDGNLMFEIQAPILLDDLLKFWPEAFLRTIGKWEDGE